MHSLLVDNFSVLRIIITLAAAYISFSLIRALYYLTLHPAAKFPGPKLRAAFYFPSYWELWTGDVAENWHELHEKYGNVVRMAPTWISVIDADAWKDIYGQTATKRPVPKDPEFYSRGGVTDIFSSNDADHARIRRLLSHAFSEQALTNQTSIITSYIDLLIQRLHQHAASNAPVVDLCKWLNFTTFDITGDLSYDESFDALQTQRENLWVTKIFLGLKLGRVFRILRAYPLLGGPLMKVLRLVSSKVRRVRREHVDQVDKRMEADTDRKDFMSYILKHNDERGMTKEEIVRTMSILIIAGSETSATLLSGAIYHLLLHATWLRALLDELRTTFHSEAEMSFATLSQLNIMNAIIHESFRMYPPVPATLPRLVGSDGAWAAGEFIPPYCSVGIPQYAAYRSKHNFTDPENFRPERWLGEEKYKEDKKDVVKPFSVGPRGCIGSRLAYAEIRMILAKLVWHFDMQVEEGGVGWEKQRVFGLWEKPRLMVRLRRRDLV